MRSVGVGYIGLQIQWNRAMQRLGKLLRFWFTFDSPVTRSEYLRHGMALAIVKYAVDAAMIWAFAHVAWTPWDYLTTGAAFQHSKLAGAPAPLLTFLAIWTLPFLWIGLTMSIRRALEAGQSAWLAMLFLVPVVNYALMALLSALPTKASRVTDRVPRRGENRLPSAALSVAVGVVYPTIPAH